MGCSIDGCRLQEGANGERKDRMLGGTTKKERISRATVETWCQERGVDISINQDISLNQNYLVSGNELGIWEG